MDMVSRTLNAAQGYSELGMFSEAIAELDSLPDSLQTRPDIVEVRLLVHMHARQWEAALARAEQLCRVAPESSGGFIHAAFCLHELGRTDEAKAVLINGPEALRGEATFHYNLACYECVLGNLAAARAHLENSVALDKKLLDFARRDPDLAVLRRETTA